MSLFLKFAFNGLYLKDDKKANWPLRIGITVGVITISTLCAAINLIYRPPGVYFSKAPSKNDWNMLTAIIILESLYFGIAMTSVIVIGLLCLKVAPRFRRTIAILYGCLAFILVSWLPHLTLHMWYYTPWGLIGLDFGFHTPVALCSLVIAFYSVKLLHAATKTTFKRITNWTSLKNIVSADSTHICAITLVLGGTLYGASYAIPKMGPPFSHAQSSLGQVTTAAESLLFGIAVALIIKTVPLIRKISDNEFRRKAWVLLVATSWIIGNWFPHFKAHSVVDMNGQFTPLSLILIEVIFHWTSEAAAAVLAYVAFGIIRMTVTVSNSEFRKSSPRVLEVSSSKIETVISTEVVSGETHTSDSDGTSATNTLEMVSQESTVIV